jgi:formylglycine-generating enzyme
MASDRAVDSPKETLLDSSSDLPGDSPQSLDVGTDGRTSTDGTGAGGTTGADGMTPGGGGSTGNGGSTGIGGTGGSGGASETGGVVGSGGSTGTPSGTPGPSCNGLAATCGPSGSEDCCTSLLVPGGTFYRSYDGVTYTDMSYPATVSDFALDRYEITVGRFRAFVNAGMGTQASPPAAGAGAHPLITGSGWDSTWNANLRADTASLKAGVSCDSSRQTWTETPGANESRPMNCITWYDAFALCAWDGGRLATEAELSYASAGGTEQRYYPWSNPADSTTIDDTYAVYCGSSCSSAQDVGTKSPKGDGKWGHADLAGNVLEWMLDWYQSPYSPAVCNNCANIVAGTIRMVRDGAFFDSASYLGSAHREYKTPLTRHSGTGARCARSAP